MRSVWGVRQPPRREAEGRLKEAVDAYAEALKLDGNNADAAFNKKLVEDELKKRQQNQDQQNQDQQNQDQQNQDRQPKQDKNPLDSEEQRALDQWLRRVPDNPGGLLERKFQKQYMDRLRRGQPSQSQGSDW